MIDLRTAATATLVLSTLVACTGKGDADPDPDTAVCLQGGPFNVDGELPVDGTAAPTEAPLEISGLRWDRHVGCERFVVDLARENGGTAVAAGPVDVKLLRALGVVRIRLERAETVRSDATDSRFDGPLARAAYVVRAPGGSGMFVDVHLAGPTEARALLLTDPARVVVDLRPGGGDLAAPAAAGQRVVILEPRAGTASYPLTVRGYARTFEANVVARLEASGETVAQEVTTATGWADAWGYYSLTIPDGPVGLMRLRVGEHSARDGTWEGVSVELDMR